MQSAQNVQNIHTRICYRVTVYKKATLNVVTKVNPISTNMESTLTPISSGLVCDFNLIEKGTYPCRQLACLLTVCFVRMFARTRG